MKKTIFYLAAILLFNSCAQRVVMYSSDRVDNYSTAPTYTPPPQAPVNYDQPTLETFYNELSPYGYWVNYQSYGYVWVPSMGPTFRPYCTGGHWVYTESGWTWASDYSWGWAPFHYGNWTYDNFYGWMWVPGYQWAPAWVTWGSYGDYYGWAPVGPGVVVNAGYRPAAECWSYVPARHINEVNVNTYVVNNNVVQYNNVTIINNYNNYNNVNYCSGPRREDVERNTGNRIAPVQIVDSKRPGEERGGNQISVYRPVINRGNNTQQAPARVIPIEQLKEKNSTEVRPQPRNDNNGNNSNGGRGNNVQEIKPGAPQDQKQNQPAPQPNLNENNNNRTVVPQEQKQSEPAPRVNTNENIQNNINKAPVQNNGGRQPQVNTSNQQQNQNPRSARQIKKQQKQQNKIQQNKLPVENAPIKKDKN